MKIQKLFEEIKKHTYTVYSPVDSWEEKPLKKITTIEFYDCAIISETGNSTGHNRYQNYFYFIKWCKDYDEAKKIIEKKSNKEIKYIIVKTKKELK
jgi:hypothetical protein